MIFKYPDLYPEILVYDDLNWVKRFIKWGALIFVLWGIAVLLNIFSDTIKAPYSYYPLRIASSVLIYWIGYQAFFRYVVLKDRIVLRKQIRNKSSSKITEAIAKNDSALQSEKHEAEFKQIHNAILEQQKYFDSQLSLDKLSEEFQISSGKLSMLVNQFSGNNFSDYINSLRVEEAKKLLKNTNFERYTIVAIGLECGFNSKSTFYTAFKKFAGQTPSAFRKQHA